MTTTSQSQEPNDAADTLSTDKTSLDTKDAQAVPVGEHIEMRQKLRAAEAKLAEMEARLSAKDSQGKQATAQPSNARDTGEVVRQLERRARVRDLSDELGLGDRKQAEAVIDLIDKNPDLTPFEAVTLAATRDPKLFPGDQTGGFQPGTHGVMRPRSGNPPADSAPKKSEFQRAVENIKKANTKTLRQERWRELVGHLAAKAVGRPHTLHLPPEE